MASVSRVTGGDETDSARGADFRASLEPCMRAMHAEMHAALAAPGADADLLFAAAMIPHHRGAVDMARQLLLHGRDPALRAFALGVIAEQQAEVEMLRAWVARRGAGAVRPDSARVLPTHHHAERSAP